MSWEKGNKTMFKGDQKPWDFFFGGGGCHGICIRSLLRSLGVFAT